MAEVVTQIWHEAGVALMEKIMIQTILLEAPLAIQNAMAPVADIIAVSDDDDPVIDHKCTNRMTRP